MPTEFQLKQSAIDCLHGMLTGRRKLSRVKGELALGVLEEMREAAEDRRPPEWVQQLAAETALELEREKRNRGKD